MRALLYKTLGLKKNSLVRRLAVLIILISSLLTLLATAVQLYIGFRWDISDIDQEMAQIARSSANSLAKSVWTFDDEQTINLLQGITTLPDIQLAEVITTSNEYLSQGHAPPPKYKMTREYPILYRGADQPNLDRSTVGTLRVTANLEGVYFRVIDKFLVILGTNLAKVVPFSLLIFLVFRTVVTRHLDVISTYLLRLNLNHLDEELVLDRPSQVREPDELEVLSRSINGMRVSLKDKVDAQKLAEKERQRLIVQLQDSLKARDEFLAIASHELRTPLTPLWIQFRLTQKVLPKLKLDPEAAKIVKSFDVYEDQLTRLTTLAESLLDISQIQSGTFELNPKAGVNLSTLIREVSEQFRPTMNKAGCPFDVEIRDEDLIVKVDSRRVGQAFGNLLSNAAKYGAGKPVKVTVSRESKWGKVAVQDHGMGISLEDQQRIFGRFERATSYRSFGGFGLGLFISKEIVQRHEGSIHVESSPGVGALFIICIPLQA